MSKYDTNITLIYINEPWSNFCEFCGGQEGGRSPGEHGAGGVPETGEERQERAGRGISTRAGSGIEIQKRESVCNIYIFFLLHMFHSKT